jgi:uncharacterized membrane protein
MKRENNDCEVSSEPTVEEILAEAERRRAARQSSQAAQSEKAAQVSPAERHLVAGTSHLIFWFAKHWLAIFNLLAFLYVGLPFLAPLLTHLDIEGPARIIHAMYRPLCHQYPFRSWYLFGSQLTYTQEELSRLVGPEALVAHGYIGDATLGFKVALCQRDTAIYGTIFLAGLVDALIRRKLRPLPLWAYLLLGVAPIGLDGGIQVLSYALPLLFPSASIQPLESTPLRRVVTGALFGLATVWLAYPYIQESASEVLETMEQRFGWRT